MHCLWYIGFNSPLLQSESCLAHNNKRQQRTACNNQFRQSNQCSGQVKDIELKPINVLKGGSYSESLPVGNYIVVASTYNKATQSVGEKSEAGADTSLDFGFWIEEV